MTSKFIHLEIPLYVAVLILLVFSASVFFVTQIYFADRIYNYSLYIPSAGKTTEPLQFGSWPAMANRNFFAQVQEKFIADKVTFIAADLSAMTITLYEQGAKVKEFPILAKGKEGSWWETPAGLYKVETKEKNHFSSFGHVYQPWSMSFQGNFFIHGWPYYPDGSPVAQSYSGGCIRLKTEDAKTIFDAVGVGTPVLVFKENFAGDNFTYSLNVPDISAKSFLAADVSSNFVFAQKSPDIELPIASISKLMTALVAVEYINMEKEIYISKADVVPTSYPRLKPGSEISLYNLLHLVLMESSNEAAEAVASEVGRERFIGLMNAKAKAIGMSHTAFTDPSGHDAGNVSTAEDLFMLAKYLLKNRLFILNMTTGKETTSAYGPLLFSNIKNFNRITADPDFIGGKVGLTNSASDTLVSIYDIAVGEERRDIAFVLLGSTDYIKDSVEILSWVKENYIRSSISEPQE